METCRERFQENWSWKRGGLSWGRSLVWGFTVQDFSLKELQVCKGKSHCETDLFSCKSAKRKSHCETGPFSCKSTKESHTVRPIRLAASLQMKVTRWDWSILLQVCKWKSHCETDPFSCKSAKWKSRCETDLFSCKSANESHTVRLIHLAASLQMKVTLWDWSI